MHIKHVSESETGSYARDPVKTKRSPFMTSLNKGFDIHDHLKDTSSTSAKWHSLKKYSALFLNMKKVHLFFILIKKGRQILKRSRTPKRVSAE